MRKERIPAPNLKPLSDRVGGPRKLRCIYCKSEYALPVRSGRDLVYECSKCHRQFTFKSVAD